MDKNKILKEHIEKYYRYKGKTVQDDDILPVSRIKPIMDEVWKEAYEAGYNKRAEEENQTMKTPNP